MSKVKNDLSIQALTIDCIGVGETKQQAVEQAFVHMRSEVLAKIEDPIISLETNRVEIIDCKQESKQEAYLGVLFKRTREKYSITLKVFIEVRYLSLEGRIL